MERRYTNDYGNARRAAGLTQERWAELLGLSPDTVKQYESGKITPGDEVVLRMAELSGQHILCYWHLLTKSRVAATMLPAVERLPLSLAVIQLLLQVEEFTERQDARELLRIAQDGRVDQSEAEQFDRILTALSGIVQAALQVKFAREDGEE